MRYKNLSSEKAKKIQIKFGRNVLPEEKTVPAVKFFFTVCQPAGLYSLPCWGHFVASE